MRTETNSLSPAEVAASDHAGILQDDAILTQRQVAQLLRLTGRTLEKYRSLGIGPRWRRIGPVRVAYRLGDIRDFIRQPAA